MKVYVTHVGYLEDYNLRVFSTWEKLVEWTEREGIALVATPKSSPHYVLLMEMQKSDCEFEVDPE